MTTQKNKFILCIVILILISVPFNFANAGWLMDAAAEAVVFVTVGWMFALVKGFLVLLTGMMATGTDAMLKMQVQNSGVVASAWNLVRQFANMFFIVIMIVMAFYTIFDLGGYNFKSLIGKFIVAALLINFSLVICGIIIDISQSISHVFLQAIGSVGERIGQGTSLGNRFGVNLSQGPGTVPVDLTAWQSAVKAFADIILLGIVFFSMAVLFVMTFIRIPILWGLMIFSPVAWITYILPSTKTINQKWWSNFIGWNAFFPIYLFFVYIGVYMLSEPNRTTILSGTNTVPLMGINFEDLFYYSLIGMVLIGGAKFAMSASMAAGAGGVAMGVWARGRTAARFSGGILARPVTSRYEAVKGAAQERIAQAKREGFGIFGGGTEAQERRQAAYAERFGVRDAKEKQLANDIGIYKKRFASYDEQRLKDQMEQGTLYEKLAAREMLNQRGQLNGKEAIDTYNLYGEAGSTVKAREFMRSLDLKRFSPGEREQFYRLAFESGDVVSSQKIAGARVESGDINDAGALINLSTLYTEPQQQLEFFKRGKEAIKNLHSSQRRQLFEQTTGEIKAFVGELMNEEKELKVDTTRGINELNDIVTILENAPGARDANNQPTGQLLNRVGKLTDSARKYNAVASTDVKLQYGLLKDSAGITLAPAQRVEALEQEIRRLDDQEFLRQSKIITGDTEASQATVNLLTPGRIDHLTSRVGANRGQLDNLKPIFNKVRQTGNLQYIREKKGPALSKTINRLKELTQQVEEAVRNRDPALNNIVRRAKDAGKSEIINARKIVGEMRSLALPPANEGMKQAAQSGLDKAVEVFDRVVGGGR